MLWVGTTFWSRCAQRTRSAAQRSARGSSQACCCLPGQAWSRSAWESARALEGIAGAEHRPQRSLPAPRCPELASKARGLDCCQPAGCRALSNCSAKQSGQLPVGRAVDCSNAAADHARLTPNIRPSKAGSSSAVMTGSSALAGALIFSRISGGSVSLTCWARSQGRRSANPGLPHGTHAAAAAWVEGASVAGTLCNGRAAHAAACCGGQGAGEVERAHSQATDSELSPAAAGLVEHALAALHAVYAV